MTVKNRSVSASQLYSECADEISSAEYDREDEFLNRPPIALQSVARALTRNWQFLDQSQINPFNADDDHYLNQLHNSAQKNDETDATPDLKLLRELWQLIADRTQRRLDELREARELLNQEIKLLRRDDSTNPFWR